MRLSSFAPHRQEVSPCQRRIDMRTVVIGIRLEALLTYAAIKCYHAVNELPAR